MVQSMIPQVRACDVLELSLTDIEAQVRACAVNVPLAVGETMPRVMPASADWFCTLVLCDVMMSLQVM